jgi:hypothetical protein
MSVETADRGVAPSQQPHDRVALTPLLLVVWGVVATILLAQGVAGLPAGVSTDDATRLVEVRDLLAGQGWFDLTQYRMNPPDGVLSHWSRLIDLPLAVLIAVATPVLGRAGAESFVLAAWPLALLLPALAGIGQVAWRLADRRAAALALILAVATTPVLTHFRLGAIDHHNVQIVLLVWTLALLLRERPGARAAAGAALMSVVSLVVGLELLPAIAVIGAGVALLWVVRGRDAAPIAIAFGLAFAAAAGALFVVTVPPGRYGAATCDAFSLAHVVAAGIAGLGLAGLAAVIRSPAPLARLAGAAGLAVMLGAVMVVGFPACLGDPYDLGPRLTALWLDHVSEARSLLSLAADLPQQIIPIYGLIVAALVLAALTIVRDRVGTRWPWLLATGVLAALFGVSLWEMRGAASADLLAVPLICAALVRLFPAGRPVVLGLTRPVLIGALVLNQAMLVPIGEAVARAVEAFGHARPLVLAGGAATCERPADFAALAGLPKGLVLAFIDNGPNILMATPHGVLAAPYHRNIAGNEAMLDMFLGSPAQASALMTARGVDYVAFCPGAPERFNYALAAPDGLAARLGRGEVPDFLERLPADSTPVTIYRVRR